MTIPLFDSQTGFGGAAAGVADPLTCEQLLEEMARLEIARSLVRTLPDEMSMQVPEANGTLYEDCATREALVPCPVLIPDGACELPAEEEQVADAVARGAGAAFLRAARDHWSPEEWCCGALLGALEDRRVPAYCIERDFPLAEVARLAQRHPGLPVILAEVGYRSQRELVPLLRSFGNVHLSIGSNYAVHLGVEHLVARVGAERILFGTGFPHAAPAMAVTLLLYADISDDAKSLIGWGNMQRLVEGIVR